jgi:hypothetical protein
VPPSAPRAAEPPKPDWLRVERHRVLDGSTDDLVTGGLGVAGLTMSWCGRGGWMSRIDTEPAEAFRGGSVSRYSVSVPIGGFPAG